MVLIAIYASLSGLLGVAITDAVQFILAMAGCIILAVIMLNSEEVGGVAGLKEKLPAWRFDFFPNINSAGSAIGTFGLTIGAFFSFIAVQWWASWYPGNEPGGGGYIVQRMLSAKDEKNAIGATFFFNVAHYALRPWPWILIALASIIMVPMKIDRDYSKGHLRPNSLRLRHSLSLWGNIPPPTIVRFALELDFSRNLRPL